MKPATLIGIITGGLASVLGATIYAVARLRRGGSSSGVRVRHGVVYGPGDFVYTVTDEDKLWLARAVWGESGERGGRPGAAIAWAMLQYLALVVGRHGQRPAFSSLTRQLRSYCQPINPKWGSMSGSGCQRHPERCTEHMLARRRQITNAGWDRIPRAVRQVVEGVLAGNIENPVPGAVDWASYDWSGSQIAMINVQGNKFGVGRSRHIYHEA